MEGEPKETRKGHLDSYCYYGIAVPFIAYCLTQSVILPITVTVHGIPQTYSYQNPTNDSLPHEDQALVHIRAPGPNLVSHYTKVRPNQATETRTQMHT